MMYSKLLKEAGLENQIFGSDYNFREANNQDLLDDFNNAVEAMGIKPDELYSCHQMHTGNVRYANGVNGNSYIVGRQFEESDGMITDRADVALLIKYADCTPVVLFDPVNQVQAIVHAGWRGTVKQISLEALNKMIKEFDCQLENILAFVGPSIDQDNYEVGPEVYQAFENVAGRNDFFKRGEADRYLLDMKGANLHLLKLARLKDSQIEVSSDSTFEDDRLHSARREGKNYQLNGLITMIKSK